MLGTGLRLFMSLLRNSCFKYFSEGGKSKGIKTKGNSSDESKTVFGDNHPTRNMPADVPGVLQTDRRTDCSFGPGSAPQGDGGTTRRQSSRSGANS